MLPKARGLVRHAVSVGGPGVAITVASAAFHILLFSGASAAAVQENIGIEPSLPVAVLNGNTLPLWHVCEYTMAP